MESTNRTPGQPNRVTPGGSSPKSGSYLSVGWCAILVLAFLVRFGAAAYWHHTAEIQTQPTSRAEESTAAKNELQAETEIGPLPLRLGDSLSYWVLAQRLGRGQSYEYGSEDAQIFRAPLYPIFLVPFTQLGQWLGSDAAGIWWARIAGAALGTWAIAIMMSLARQHFGVCAALAAGCLAAVHPGSVGASLMILSEPLFMPLMLLSIASSLKSLSSDHNSAARSLGCGAFCGLATLARPSWLLFLPFAIMLGLAFSRERSRWLRFAALAVVGCCVVMSPWWIRSATITGQFVPSTLQVGLSLYDGWHEGATGASDEGMAFAFDIQAEQRELDSKAKPEEIVSTFEYRVDALAKQKALHWASENPFEVLRLAAVKFTRTWSLWPDGGELSSNRIRFAITVGTFAIVLLAIAATVLLLRRPGAEPRGPWLIAFCWLPCIYFTLLHMVFVGSIRYREPAILVLCPLAGVTLAWLAGCFSRPAPLVEIQSVQGRASATDSISSPERSD